LEQALDFEIKIGETVSSSQDDLVTNGLAAVDNSSRSFEPASPLRVLVDKSAQTEPEAADNEIRELVRQVSVGCEARESSIYKSAGCQTGESVSRTFTPADQTSGGFTRTSTVSELRLPATSSPSPRNSLTRTRWDRVTLVEPDSLAELALHPALSVWTFLFKSTAARRKALRIQDPDDEMQRLTLRWLDASADCDETRLAQHAVLNLGKLLKVRSLERLCFSSSKLIQFPADLGLSRSKR
jgi:hypothetical protein